MSALSKTWAIALIVVAIYYAMGVESDYRAAQIDRCSVVHCS